MRRCVMKLRNRQKTDLNSVFKNEMTLGWLKIELTFAYQGEEYFIAGVISRQPNLK